MINPSITREEGEPSLGPRVPKLSTNKNLMELVFYKPELMIHVG